MAITQNPTASLFSENSQSIITPILFHILHWLHSLIVTQILGAPVWQLPILNRVYELTVNCKKCLCTNLKMTLLMTLSYSNWHVGCSTFFFFFSLFTDWGTLYCILCCEMPLNAIRCMLVYRETIRTLQHSTVCYYWNKTCILLLLLLFHILRW